MRLRDRAALAALVSAIAVIAVLPAAAQTPTPPPDRHDVHLWTQVVATVSLPDQWLVHLEAQPRWADNVSESDQTIIRTALGRKLTPRVTLWGGYAWVPRTRGAGVRHEQRIWEQLSATFPNVGAWAPSMRIRLEQRMLDGWGDTSHRLRMMGRAVRPLDAEKNWSIATWNEFFVTFDDTPSGPPAGPDQNRLFAGILRKLSSKASLETGYVWQSLEPTATAPRLHNHVAFVWLNLTL